MHPTNTLLIIQLAMMIVQMKWENYRVLQKIIGNQQKN